MSEDRSDSTDRVRQLDDAFRRTFVGGVVVVTAGVEAVPRERRQDTRAAIRAMAAIPGLRARTRTGDGPDSAAPSNLLDQAEKLGFRRFMHHHKSTVDNLFVD